MIECISPTQLAAELDAGAAEIVDVREPLEFGSEHIAGARHIPLGELERRIGELPCEAKVTLVCRSGIRATQAAETLKSRGRPARVLEGGMLAWTAAGLPAVTGRKRLGIDRQVQITVGTSILACTLLGVALHPGFLVVPGLFGAGLVFAGVTGTCPLAMVLAQAPWNRTETPGAAACGTAPSASRTSPAQAKPQDREHGCCGGH